jgi:DnaJ-class molecular chaperone
MWGAQRTSEFNRGGYGSIPYEAHMKTCPDCNGDGVIEKGTDDEQQCPTCGGRGFVPDDDDDQEVINTKRPN